jgi:hypothetical protein
VGYGLRQSLFLSVAIFGVSQSAVIAAENFAKIQSFQGKVLVNRGQGFAPAQALMTLKIGDRVLVSHKSSVSVSYSAAGCSAVVDRPSLFKISKATPCGTELISSTLSGAPLVAPIVGVGMFGSVAGAVALPAVGWGVTQVLSPYVAASLP